MKFAGLAVMPAGFLLTIAALVLFANPGQRIGFVICGLAVEALGLGFSIRAHTLSQREDRL